MREDAVGHQWISIIGARPRPDHVCEVTRLIISIAGDSFCLVDTALGWYAAVEFPQRFIGCPPRLIEGDGQVHAVILYALETADGLAEDNTLAGVFIGEFKNFLAGAHL